jgi:uncharacterized membrane protein YedE/YeeE
LARLNAKLSLSIGGLMFGVSTAIIGNCGFGTLVRAGGDLRAIVLFLVLGLAALATMRGVTGMLRVLLIEPLSLRLPAGTNQKERATKQDDHTSEVNKAGENEAHLKHIR